jgi:hypothetical protein
MTKQDRLNQFLLDFADFLEKYYSSALTDISRETVDGAVRLKVFGPAESLMELWADGAEILIEFGEDHWHVDDYGEPCCYENIYENVIDGVLDVLNGRQSTYSCWSAGRVRGGGTCRGCTLDSAVEAAGEFFHGADEIRLKVWARETETHKIQQGQST